MIWRGTSGSGEVIAALINAGKIFHFRSPVMSYKSDVIRHAKAKSLQPVGNVCVEGDEGIGFMISEPFFEGVETEADVIFGKQEKGDTVFGGQSQLPVKKATGITELRAVHDPLGYGDADAPVATGTEFFRSGLDS